MMSSDTFYIYFLCNLALLVYRIFFNNTKKFWKGRIIMLVVKIIICILTFIAFVVARVKYEDNYLQTTRASNIVACVAGILGITFCILLITTNWNLFTVPEILLFISVCLYILFHKKGKDHCVPFLIGEVVTVIAFVVAGIMYLNNIEECEVPHVSITSTKVICAKDNSSITGSVSGSVFYVQGSVSEECVYKYYYQVEDGGIKQGTIPVDFTTIYFVESGEEAYLETIVTTEYSLNKNNTPATIWHESSETTYKLYIPEGSITNVYEFNAE